MNTEKQIEFDKVKEICAGFSVTEYAKDKIKDAQIILNETALRKELRDTTNSRKMIDMAPGDTSVTIPALANIGDMYYEMGNEKEAFTYYKQVLKANPDYSPTLNNYAYYLALKGKSLKKACAMSKKTVDRNPDNSTYLDTYGWILHLLGKDQDAKAVFKRAMIYGAKDSATSLGHYAAVLEALGEYDLAKVYRTQEANKKAEGKD